MPRKGMAFDRLPPHVQRQAMELDRVQNPRRALLAPPAAAADPGKPRLRQKREKMSSKTEQVFKALLHVNGVPFPTQEHRFHAVRKWRFDYAWLDKKVAVEVEGGVWTGGRHTRGRGFLGDMEKYNAAVFAGWKLLRFTPDQLLTGATARMILSLIT